jgi:hypothetical protein
VSSLTRRRVLRGIMNGGVVSVALPLLDCFLNGNGTALASGAPMPVRFGTWYWGLGMSESVFVPKKRGANFDLPEEIAALKPVQKHINLFTNFNCYRDAAPNLCHYTGWVILRSGNAPTSRLDHPGETIDVTVAKNIGTTTRFQSLSACATGDARDAYSYENANAITTSESSPIAFYQRLFGADFPDPNGENFMPDPRVMVRKSVLSSVLDDARSLSQRVGSEDKARLDQYFSGLRDLERQLDQQLKKPEPIAACRPAPEPPDMDIGLNIELITKRHQLMTDIMVMAAACDQTRVFNMAYASEFAGTSRIGYDKPHHTATHEEPVDEKLGYQPMTSWFTRRAMESWAYFVGAFAMVKEGDGTLLDNTLVYATTDQSFAKIHSTDGVPMFSAGRAGGRMKTGLHVDGGGSAATRLGLTSLRVMGLDTSAWGSQSNNTSKDIGEILA